MKTLSTVWIDVTDLEKWRGSLTGIQRTHFEIAKHLIDLGNVKFFTFSPDLGYFEVDLPNENKFGTAKLNTELTKVNELNGFTRVIRALQELIASLLPSNIKKSLVSLTQKRTIRKAWKKTSPYAHPFGENDILLFLGVTWSVESHLTGIINIKQSFNLKILSLVYDLIPVLKPHFFGKGFPAHYTNHLIDTIHISDLLFSISESTSKDLVWLISETNAPSKPIVNIRLGDNPILASPEKPSTFPDGWDRFVLSVGTFEIRKNHDLLYKVWDKAVQEQIQIPNLVIAGRPGWLTHDLEYSIKNNPNTNNKILILNECTDTNLKWLYQNCLFTIYPSWYEGWGLPIAESAFEGKLCLSSNISSMPEIAGELMDYFSPFSTEKLLSLVHKYSNDFDALRAKELKLSEYKPTMWRDTASRINEVLDNLQDA